MVNAVERVRQRLLPYAIVGGNAVAAWVATVDEAAVRNTQDVDVLIRRGDFDAAKAALESAGFVHRKAAGIDLFLDNEGASPRDAVHVIFASEKVRAHEPAANPDVSEATQMGAMRVLNLDALVRIKLTAYRDKDRTHIRDLIDIGLVDVSWTDRLPALLAERLKELLATPEG
jgi:hypothetical protein